jgi:hypothetical protein
MAGPLFTGRVIVPVPCEIALAATKWEPEAIRIIAYSSFGLLSIKPLKFIF